MPHALLLSPDDQAVSAITGVLEEMSVTCERPLDGVTAAQKLNSHSFDLVLVDCENLPAAKLIFDVCRRGKNGHNPVPIAIVDGRAGLPTAFRLGAELILTKPVAKDQARTTVRTAVSRLRKDIQPAESIPAQPVTTATSTEEHAQGAAATAVSEQLTSFAEPAPSFVPSAAPSSASTATLSAPALTTTMHSAVDEIDVDTVTLKSRPQPATPSASPLSESSSAATVPASSKPAHPPSDDPVLAELERTELEESELDASRVASSGPDKPPSVQPVAEPVAPVVSSQRQGKPKGRGPLVALLVLVLAAGGFYAAWMYQPGFRAMAQPQIDQVLALAGLAHKPQSLPPTPTPKPANPSAQPAPVNASAPESPTDPNQTQPTVAGPTNGAATDAATTTAVVTAPAQPAATPATVVAKPTSGATPTAAPLVIALDTGKAGDSKKDASPATSSNVPLPGERSAIILSSKGAEKRLAYSPAPKYPAAALSGESQGTVVLKAVVDESGNVAGLRLVEGNATLATAAIQAVKQWRYRPYLHDGKAEPFQTVVIVDFQRP